MANVIGYEELLVRDRPVGPTSAFVVGGVACAVFYVDPGASGPVNWLPAFGQRDTDGVLVRDADNLIIPARPTRNFGFPLSPDKAVTVAGEGTIRNTRFIRTGAKGGVRKVHCLYFDRVDVVASDFVGATSLAALETVLLRIEALQKDQIKELGKQTTALESGTEIDH